MRQFLVAHSRDELAEWILGVAAASTDFKQRLDFYAGTHRSPADAAVAVRAAVDQFNDLTKLRRTLKQAEIVKPAIFLLESIDACLSFGFRDDVLDLIETAMQSLDRLLSQVLVRNARLDDLQKEFSVLHLRAAKLGNHEPIALAQRIFALRETALGPIATGAPGSYTELLGTEGLARFRELLEPTFQIVVNQAVPVPRQRRDMQQFMNRRRMLFDWAMLTEELDEKLAVLIAFAQLPSEILNIAGILDAQQRPMDALVAVRRAHERNPSQELATNLAQRYESQGQASESIPYRWYLFEEGPVIDQYDALIATAAQANQAKAWSERAMSLAQARAPHLYIELLLRENRLEAALGAARASGAPLDTWFQLAGLHAAIDPRTAIGLYFDCVHFSFKGHQGSSPATPIALLVLAWQLASNAATFQAFNGRLRALFAKEQVPKYIIGQLEAEGIPIERLLK